MRDKLLEAQRESLKKMSGCMFTGRKPAGDVTGRLPKKVEKEAKVFGQLVKNGPCHVIKMQKLNELNRQYKFHSIVLS